MSEKSISVVTPCYNEESNVLLLYNQVREIFKALGRFKYEHIFIDNASTDRTVQILTRIALQDPNVKVIVNSRNFGQVTSPVHAMLQARGDAVISMVADLQDPPPMILDMIREWENGAMCVVGIKRSSEEASLMFWIRKQYYRTVERLSPIETIQNFTGFGLYDRKFMEIVRQFGDAYPFFRGMVAEIGLPTVKLLYDQPQRKFGITSNNWYSLYDVGISGIISFSKVPLRLAVIGGFLGALMSLVVAFAYFIAKLCFWSTFSIGIAPIVSGLFFVLSLMLIALGIIGEYVGATYTEVRGRPLAIERLRLNFDSGLGEPRETPVVLESLPS